MRFFFVLSVIIILCSGCGIKSYHGDRVYDSNLKSGTKLEILPEKGEHSSTSGDNVVSCLYYNFSESNRDFLISNKDFSMSATLGIGSFSSFHTVSCKKDKKYLVESIVSDNGVMYSAIKIEGTTSCSSADGAYILVSEDGVVKKTVTCGSHSEYYEISGFPVEVLDGVKFNKVNDIKEDKTLRYTADIIFLGVDGDNIKFQYREFTSSGLARKDYFQDFTYPKTAKFVEFKDMKFNINSVTPSKIYYQIP